VKQEEEEGSKGQRAVAGGGRRSAEPNAQDDSDAPNVHFKRMAVGRIKENFGSNIVRCPTDGPVGPSQVDQLPTPSLNAEHHSLLPLPGKLDQRRQSEIADP
jgi:hypothetical protein